MVWGQPIDCVLIDSVQSQANRLEEALLNAANQKSANNWAASMFS